MVLGEKGLYTLCDAKPLGGLISTGNDVNTLTFKEWAGSSMDSRGGVACCPTPSKIVVLSTVMEAHRVGSSDHRRTVMRNKKIEWYVPDADAPKLLQMVNDQKDLHDGAPAPAAAPAQAAMSNHADDLKKLASLRDQGILTEEEFAQKKAEILAKM